MKELKPRSLEDLIAGISLYRPGPMDFIPQYIKGKNNQDSVTYACPQLEAILKPTYGCIVYQEQVMQIVRDLAGYSWGRSDLVRRAMSKKKAYVMEQERKNFIYGNKDEGVKGCVNNGIDEKVAGKIYDDMIDFAKYAFNKSHAACYAVVSFQTAYLKTYYTVEFMAALMNSVIDNTSKVAGYIYACKQMNIAILPPDVNESQMEFTVENGKIRFAMAAIKSLGRPTIQAILKERGENGSFISMQDFVTRMSQALNRRAIENFVKAGAFDTFGHTRKSMMIVSESMLDSAIKHNKDSMTGQMSLFDFAAEEDKKAFDNTAALTKGVEVLARVEAEAAQVSQCSHISVLKLCSVSLGTILHHKQSVTVCDLADSRIVKRLTVEVNTDNAFRLFRDLSLQYGRIDLPGIRRTVCEHRCGSCIAYPPCSCYISIGRNDHFIPGAYTQCQHCQMQSGGTVVDTTGKFASHIGGKLFVKGICIFPAGKSGLFTYVLNGFPVGFRMRLHISCQIDSFNMCHGIILLSSVSGAKALNLDAYGLFRATHL